MADSVLLAQLRKWVQYPPEQVEAGIRTYLEKDCAGNGKGEAYLLGIIRNHTPAVAPSSWWDQLQEL